MLPVSSVVRFPLGFLQIARDELGLHAVQESTVKKEGLPFPLLCIARNFETLDGQVADSPEGDVRMPSMERGRDPFEDELIGAADAREVRIELKRKYERIGEASRSLQDGPAAARPPQKRYAVLLAGGDMDIIGDIARAAQHHEVAVALPEPEHGIPALLFQFVQQRFVEGKILDRGGQGQIKQAERAHGITAWTYRCVWLVR